MLVAIIVLAGLACFALAHAASLWSAGQRKQQSVLGSKIKSDATTTQQNSTHADNSDTDNNLPSDKSSTGDRLTGHTPFTHVATIDVAEVGRTMQSPAFAFLEAVSGSSYVHAAEDSPTGLNSSENSVASLNLLSQWHSKPTHDKKAYNVSPPQKVEATGSNTVHRHIMQKRMALDGLKDLKLGPILGLGSYGKVYKGCWKGAKVAVKVVEQPDGVADCFMSTESLLSSYMSHPCVVATYHVAIVNQQAASALGDQNTASHIHSDDVRVKSSSGRQSSNSNAEAWMIMEYCDKGSLHKPVMAGRFRNKRTGMPDMAIIYGCLLDIASGLEYLHFMDIIHADLKLSNVLLKSTTAKPYGFVCKLGDFGLSKLSLLDKDVFTQSHGTLAYMPPEVLSEGKLSKATDVYSFGLLMWELYTGEEVFGDITMGQVFYMISYLNHRPTIPDHCPPAFADLMQRCWATEPDARPSCNDLVHELQSMYAAQMRVAGSKHRKSKPKELSDKATAAW
eukprot:jgi/Chrzof1/3569/Cz13g00210.t1